MFSLSNFIVGVQYDKDTNELYLHFLILHIRFRIKDPHPGIEMERVR